MLPDLTIHQVQRDDLECEEGDRIVQVRPTALCVSPEGVGSVRHGGSGN